ncbi:MAG: T9SS type A sorting domain-containing protein [Saprospiraceae bacterium]|nr:T9SS type A sorting domain-containing protein [Saprospiraceae bacterium]
MKRFYIFLSIAFFMTLFTTSVQSQNVTIPDSIFKAYLIGNSNINTNGDSEIQITEAQAHSGTINVNSLGISDLTGIEVFTALNSLMCRSNQLTTLNVSNNTALTTLNCNLNQLTALDVSNNIALLGLSCNNNQLSALSISNNTALTSLDCGTNQLTALDVSNNTALTSLRCQFNQLTALDVSNNTALTTLICANNQLSTLNVSNNIALTSLWCQFNQLTALDVSNNTALTSLQCNSNQLSSLDIKNGNNLNITTFKSNNNPNLFCIQVDSTAYSLANWTNIDPASSFSTDCSTFSSTLNLPGILTDITIFPNPTTKNLTLQLIEYQLQELDVQICNSMGQVVFERTYENAQQVELELKGAPGIYFVRVRTDEGEGVLTVIKE